MLVDDYFAHLENVIDSSDLIRTKLIHKDKRSDQIGYLRADLYMHDGSVLYVREFVISHPEVTKDVYAYHYQDSFGRLIFRYDNARHFPQLPTFPHHKHTPSGIIAVAEPKLEDVLCEIALLIEPNF